jgi:Kef-type K+ transport system membrane component KefB
MSEFHALFIMGFVAAFAPLLARLPAFIRMPAVVLELMLGIVIGPSGVGWVTSHGAIGFLGEFLIFLFSRRGSSSTRKKLAPRRFALAYSRGSRH